ncbi:MAG: CHASE2 domain-containing protein [Elainellaceae cyanobacterium]
MLTQFRLRVQQIDPVCLFELSWGEGQYLTASVAYPESLSQHYHTWQQTYLSFYKTAPLSVSATPHSTLDGPLRGRVLSSGSMPPPSIDWHAKLVQAETLLLYEFQQWLRRGELFEIRAAIAQASQQLRDRGDHRLQIFLTCDPVDLARFPWEAWEIGTDFGATGAIRIVRSPINIRSAAGNSKRRSGRRARILAVLGDETGLNFQVDRDAVRSLSRIAEVKFVGWQPGQSAAELKTQICRAIADEAGWDVLFFAGHSNETLMTGGELAIAPNATLTMRELAPHLTTANQHGLQFALFNSCNGLNLAESLIDLGLSQVAVMREPIHNRVAQEFLVRFLHSLANHDDVQTSLVNACQFLKTEKQFTHPSAYLVPSLFCHPGAMLFRIPPNDWKHQMRRVMPKPYEAIALAACLTLAVLPPVQKGLLNQRVWSQSVYRNLTQQIPDMSEPPVMLVQIDEKSIRLSGMTQPNPIDRQYLARILDELVRRDAQVVGIDYLLDRQQPENDPTLGQSIRRAVEQGVWLVFAGLYSPQGEISVGEATNIASPNWSMAGYIEAPLDSLMLPDSTEDCRQTCPFAYVLSILAAIQHPSLISTQLQPSLNRSQDLRTQLFDTLEQGTDPHLVALGRSRFHPLNTWAYETLGQSWLSPIIDYSIPPEQVYNRIAAWGLLDRNSAVDEFDLAQPVIIVASGQYAEAGIDPLQSDTFAAPRALRYWRNRQEPSLPASSDQPINAPITAPEITGAEVHAYAIHHLLNQQWVTAIPDLWMVGAAVLVGQGMVVLIRSQPFGVAPFNSRHGSVGLAIATLGYGWLSLQLYISAHMLLPWMLPTVIVWVYVLPSFRRNAHG